MPRETQAERTQRAGRIIEALRSTYPNAHCELNFSNPLELLIATILSAQCTDKQVNLVTPELFRRYPTAADYAQANPEELAHQIRRIGLFRNKAKNIQAACVQLVQLHGGVVPADMDSLVALPGVGRKTANVVLGNAFDLNLGIVVDTHVARLANRLKLTSETDPVRIEQDLQKWVPRPQWTLFSHWLIWHGRRRCGARNPGCLSCEIRPLCPSAEKLIAREA